MFIPKNTNSQQRYFYSGIEFGSQSTFNPVTYILNGGFDILQVGDRDRRIFKFPYAQSFNTVWQNLRSPFDAINQYGTSKFISDEVFPTEIKTESGQWVPNYAIHLIGGGMSSAALTEWYDCYGFPVPAVFSGVTVAIQHLLNEVVENYPKKGVNVDPIADIYIFDIAGVVLFSFDGVKDFFGNTLNMRDWSLQPSVTFPDGKLQNVGQYFALKWELPFSKNNYLFTHLGMGGLFGLSHKINQTDAISFGAGVKTTTTIKVDNGRNKWTVGVKWSAALFWDSDNSLLASLKLNGMKDYFCELNIYPGVIKLPYFSPGIWSVIGLDGNFTFGISTRYSIGIGYN